MGIEVLDHVIISGIEKNRYYSFKESGVLEETARYGKKIQKETDKENNSALSVSSSIKETGTNYEVTDTPFYHQSWQIQRGKVGWRMDRLSDGS